MEVESEAVVIAVETAESTSDWGRRSIGGFVSTPAGSPGLGETWEVGTSGVTAAKVDSFNVGGGVEGVEGVVWGDFEVHGFSENERASGRVRIKLSLKGIFEGLQEILICLALGLRILTTGRIP